MLGPGGELVEIAWGKGKQGNQLSFEEDTGKRNGGKLRRG